MTASPLTPLATGARLQGRFTILEIVRSDTDRIVYRARDELSCPDPACQAENSVGEQFCHHCGRELNTRGTCLLEEIAAPDAAATLGLPAFRVDNRIYFRWEDPTGREKTTRLFASGVQLRCAARSDAGLVAGARGDPDEDSAFAASMSALYQGEAKPPVGLFMVADGIGGSAAGELASRGCVAVVASELTREVLLPLLQGEQLEGRSVRQSIQDAVGKANQAVMQAAHEGHADMGTTITLALIVDDYAYVANVGDSRTYLFTDGSLTQITHDHSLVAGLIERGLARPDEIHTHPQRNVILRGIGEPDPVVDLFPVDCGGFKLEPGDRLLLCCDGLWAMLRDQEIEEQMWQEPDPDKLARKLVARANEMGGHDNISVVVVNVEG
jgi:serine/threonine protein phosphatase PrpC